jgi:formyltetrahydrofolate synthetase
LMKHIENAKKFGVSVVVAINKFTWVSVLWAVVDGKSSLC